jgi:hypothetical protein
MRIRKGDKVRILEIGEEALVAVVYHWGLIGVLIFDGEIPRRLLWLNENEVEKIKERD